MNLLWMFTSALADGEEAVTAAAETAKEYPTGIALVIVVIALIIAIAVVSSMKAQLKTAHKRSGAVEYIKQGSFDLRVNKDQFLYETTEKRKIENPNNNKK